MTKLPILGVVSALTCGLVGAASNAAAQTIAVSVDATAAGTPLKKVWSFHGYDEANYTTTTRGRALLGALATMHTAPVYVRTHFLLNTGDGSAALKWGSTNAYTEDASGNPVYNWTILDGILDAITNAGAFPLNEIAFMPQALLTRPNPYRNSDTYALDGGCFYPPTDYAKWGTLIRAWATHVSGRYPGAESTWQWELWNEPDIGYWHGTFAEFARMYDYTEANLHAVMPNASLGGPSVAAAGSSFFTQFLQHCATGTNAVSGQTGTRLDMVSFHAKGGVAIAAGHVQMNLGNQMRLHRTGFNAVAAVSQFRQTPIVVSEADPDGCAACPVSQTPADAYRLSPAYGAYEVAMMKKTLELEAQVGVNLRGLLTWAFMFENAPYFTGYRELETNGIHLPVLNAFKLLGRLNGTRMPVTSSGARALSDILTNSVRGQPDIDALATRNGAEVQVLVWNYHDDLVTVAASPVTLSVTVPPAFGSRATVTHLRVDETHGDAYTVWISQNRPAAPSSAQLAALRAAMEPTPLEPERTVDVTNGNVSVSFELPRFGISLVTLAPAAGMGGMGGMGGMAAGSGGVSGAGLGGGGVAGVGVGGLGGVGGSDGATGGSTAGASGTGATTAGMGGVAANGGRSTTAGMGGQPSGGDSSAGSPAGATVPTSSKDDAGCGCRLASQGERSDGAASFLAALALALFGRRRRNWRPGEARSSRASSY